MKGYNLFIPIKKKCGKKLVILVNRIHNVTSYKLDL